MPRTWTRSRTVSARRRRHRRRRWRGCPSDSCAPLLFPPPYEVAKIAFDQGLSSTSKQIGTGASTLRQVASNFETTDADVANRGQRYYL